MFLFFSEFYSLHILETATGAYPARWIFRRDYDRIIFFSILEEEKLKEKVSVIFLKEKDETPIFKSVQFLVW